MIKSDENQKCLQNSDLNSYFNSQELNLLLEHSSITSFSPNEIILQQGKKTDKLYIILEGVVLVSAKILGEGTTNLEKLMPGNFLGEISFIEKIPCATSAIANSDVKCLVISDTYIELLATYFPETKYKLFHAISIKVCDRLKRMHDKITEFISHSDMTSRSFFSEFIQSFTKPKKIAFKNADIDINHLYEFSAFRYFTKNEIDELIKHAVLISAPKYCTLIHQDDKNASCYIVLHGAVQSSIVHNNIVAKLSVIGPETLFASIGCVTNDLGFTVTFTTCENAVLLKISKSNLDYFKENYPIVWYKIFNLISRSLVALEKSVDKLDIRLNIETYNR